VREGLRLLEQREQEHKSKVEWLRAAEKGFDAADHGDYVSLRSDEEIQEFINQARRRVSEKLNPERARGFPA
jgi:Arc/MetJ-type ribon-helix-helix transcriptional regulator